MVGYYQDKLMKDFICHSAWQSIPTNALVGMLDIVRNMTLKMALEIKDELGTSYTDLQQIKSNEAEKIHSIVINAIGGSTNVAIGQASIDASGQGQTVIVAGDRKSLDSVLTKAGLDLGDLEALTEAIQADGRKKPGAKVTEWIKAKASKVVASGVKAGVSIGQQLLTEWLMQHYGLK